MPDVKGFTEELKVEGKELVETVKRIIHEGNVRRVVVRNPEKHADLPRGIVQRAAELAAWHSKAHDGGRVEVHACRVADVGKRRGAPAGEVVLRQSRRLRVYPRPYVPPRRSAFRR